MSQSKVRVGGSGYTVMTWQGQRLAYCQQLDDQAPQAVGPAEAIQAIDDEHPVEIVTAQAVRGGTLSLKFYETWLTPVWGQLPGFEGTNNLLDVLKRQLQLGEITCRKVIKVPNGPYRTTVYHNCVITDFDGGESVVIGTMSLPKSVRIQYTHTSTV
ncbi:virion structural protein [Rhodococcus phage Finch]|uniref:Tail tube protein n=1 Tax=Rhodococcus phage Finch TaxID=2094144 RepID=A0A2P1JXE2_9CAUD|nr:virion structural protein [Rhodococcus phage Finch]AVO24983.1 hypothetical protein SEA_FINCH_43 [Rhodococcus phage Finch]